MLPPLCLNAVAGANLYCHCKKGQLGFTGPFSIHLVYNTLVIATNGDVPLVAHIWEIALISVRIPCSSVQYEFILDMTPVTWVLPQYIDSSKQFSSASIQPAVARCIQPAVARCGYFLACMTHLRCPVPYLIGWLVLAIDTVECVWMSVGEMMGVRELAEWACRVQSHWEPSLCCAAIVCGHKCSCEGGW